MLLQIVGWFIVFCCCYTGANDITYPCTTANGETGICISLYSCRPLLKYLGSLNPPAIEFVKRSRCGKGNDTLLVCCGFSETFANLFVISESNKTLTASTDSVKIPTTVKSVEEEETSLLDTRKYCGMQHTDDRFFNETTTAIDEFPWLVLLSRIANGKSTPAPVCSGTIINRRYVITIAECVTKYNITSVQVGLYNRKKDVTCIENPNFPECTDPALLIKIEDTIIHPLYSSESEFSHDIALLRLVKNLEFTDYIRPICLPMEWSKRPKEGTVLSTSGWGSQIQFGDNLLEVKKRTSQTLLSHEECLSKNPAVFALINPMVICTSPFLENPSNLACWGDAGGPLMYTYRHQFFIEGILVGNIGSKNCSSEVISTNVTSYLQWIVYNIHA